MNAREDRLARSWPPASGRVKRYSGMSTPAAHRPSWALTCVTALVHGDAQSGALVWLYPKALNTASMACTMPARQHAAVSYNLSHPSWRDKHTLSTPRP